MAVPRTPLIACVDDDFWARDALRGLLRALGFSPEAFSSAEEFLQSPRLAEVSCVITDLHLPGMSGVELQGRLAALGYRIPIIVITAYPNNRVRQQALSAGAVGFLEKPFDTQELLACITAALRDRHDNNEHP